MLTIYGRTNSVNVQKVLWCLAELALPYTRIDAGLEHGKNDEPWYLALNPNGRIPLLTTARSRCGNRTRSCAILAGKHGHGGLCPASLESARARGALDGLAALDADRARLDRVPELDSPAQPPSATPARSSATCARRTARWRCSTRISRARPYVAGDAFTMGDIPVGAVAHRWLEIPGIERPPLAAVRAWRARLARAPRLPRARAAAFELKALTAAQERAVVSAP